jgi:hypothetical protein
MIEIMGSTLEEIQRRLSGQALLTETDIWNALLDKACHDAENHIGEGFRIWALNAVDSLPDSENVVAFDATREGDALFVDGKDQFHRKCTEQRSDFTTMIPGEIAAADNRLHLEMHNDLTGYHDGRVRLLERLNYSLSEAEAQAVEFVDGLDLDTIPSFNMVATRRDRSTCEG